MIERTGPHRQTFTGQSILHGGIEAGIAGVAEIQVDDVVDVVDVRAAGVVSIVVVPIRTHQCRVAVDGDADAEVVACHAVGGGEFLELAPTTVGLPLKDVRGLPESNPLSSLSPYVPTNAVSP